MLILQAKQVKLDVSLLGRSLDGFESIVGCSWLVVILDLVLNLCLSVMLISGYIAGGTLVLGKLLPAGAFVK